MLRKALRDDDAEVRFRVRRILGGPELRVARVIETLLEPQKTDDVRATMKALVDRADRGSVVFGLLRVARKAIASGVDSDTRFTQ
ncbi:hypothetical protein HY251_02455, partial [bacterium]|nr:hypothetical protein [bacterium]